MWEKYKYSALPHTLEGQTPATKPDASHSWLTWCCHVWITCLSAIILLLTLPISIWCFLKIVPDYERVVVFRLGRIRPPKGPGLILLLPLIDQLQRVDMRIRAFRIQPCKVKSRDDVLVSVEAGVQFRVCDPVLSVLSVQDLNFVIQNTAENLLVQNFGRKYLREIYGDKMRLGEHFKEDINEQVKPLGVCVEHVDLLVEAVMQPHEEHVPLTSQAVNPNGGLEQLIMQFVSIATQVSAQDTKPSTGSGLCGMGILTFSPDVTLEITEADLLSVVRGDLNPMIAYTTGRLHVTGNLQTALLLQKVLPKILHS
ncbi:stomatin-like protein 1 isoform X3 [Hyla sarda]|uniref:stomatin-like protein 1 isoform X3 n=1 Tax=Hyla sarda TaxID=327740 RepID=UPI0024C3D7A2|nr:stomatin-like protein 1 isoform X3 [Hyla sarda]